MAPLMLKIAKSEPHGATRTWLQGTEGVRGFGSTIASRAWFQPCDRNPISMGRCFSPGLDILMPAGTLLLYSTKALTTREKVRMALHDSSTKVPRLWSA